MAASIRTSLLRSNIPIKLFTIHKENILNATKRYSPLELFKPIHTTGISSSDEPKSVFDTRSQNWMKKNEIIYPPQEPGDERRSAWVCHQRTQIKYSPDKMLMFASVIRGLSIDEAVKQMSFTAKKGPQIIKEVLLEAQEKAVQEHNVQYKSNLWVSHSIVGKGSVVKGLRKHARMRFGLVRYKYCHYFVCLTEGSPPKHYYPPDGTGYEKLAEYLAIMRYRTVKGSL